MTAKEGNSALSIALDVAARRFPENTDRLQRLFHSDETFRSMCEDLAAAVEALRHFDRQQDHVRESRRAEYASLIEALVGEIGEALTSKIVILKHFGEDKPKQA